MSEARDYELVWKFEYGLFGQSKTCSQTDGVFITKEQAEEILKRKIEEQE